MKKDENAVVDAAGMLAATQKLVNSGKTVVSKVVILGIFGKIKLVIFGKTGYIWHREVEK